MKEGQLRYGFGRFLRDLHTTCTGADQGNLTSAEIDTLLRPARCVKPLAFEILKAGKIGDIRLGCETKSGQQESCRNSFVAVELQTPLLRLLLIVRASDPTPHAHHGPQV